MNRGPGFTRTVEDFVCLRCGTRVQGDGYTNHCPHCLWSLHVDDDPGDRACECRGLMEPVGLECKGESYVLTHRCRECGATKRNRVSPADEREALYRLARRLAEGPRV